MNQWRGGLQSLHRIVDVGQFLVFNIDEPNRLVCDRFAIRSDSRDRITARANFVEGKHRLVFNASADEDVFHIGPRENSADTLQRLGF